ncbi:universal stress protein [Halobiforma lacisalsi AJ5]|uniref:Universal stress protein n=1 Tax=Natronobacterium lacisalsi AJ5 TaxID=358396 RepID=M0LJL6_NATLA|nr:universal stress protein [Halobiforma lacisalsi]APW98481.1 universal stress protein [Halobiforma lacisalsi AJ5]EMA33258.1 UspA domain-containing protein [Halobiforma lacisalsi AJ5]
MYETILVATDGSEPGSRAAEHAIDLASTFDADLHATYVVDTRRYGGSVVDDSGEVLSDLEDRGNEILSDIAARASVDVERELRQGRPHEEIGALAEEIDADLIVLGNRGLGSGGEIGSVAERVVRYVDRPVLTA